jgi:hypothetical protein
VAGAEKVVCERRDCIRYTLEYMREGGAPRHFRERPPISKHHGPQIHSKNAFIDVTTAQAHL